MLPLAYSRNQFDTLGKALAQYMPVLSYPTPFGGSYRGGLGSRTPDEVWRNFFGIVETLALSVS